MEKAYSPIDGTFRDHLKAAATRKRYVSLHYFTELHEYMRVMVVVLDIVTKNQMEFLALSNGEEIRLDQIVRIDALTAPRFAHFDDYSCDC